ncbi:MAG: ParB/RepB/Spo0J family partition protein [Deltaproteobacteria bacterium]|jgi:hypothetical protein|nr:ParB/RepB/Spo0J family partition protein [Deltaproteobacteria bacterium]
METIIPPLRPFKHLSGYTDRRWPGPFFSVPTDELTSCRLSVGRPIDELAKSIDSIGLLHALWVAQGPDGRAMVISGGRRLAALRLLGRRYVSCLAPSCEMVTMMLMVFTDNLSRGYNEAEKALAWNLAKNTLKESELESIKEMLNIPKQERLSALERAVELPENGLLALAAGRLDLDNITAFSHWSRAEISSALDLFDRTLPSRQNRKQWLEWLNDLRRIEAISVDYLLQDPQLSALGGPNGEKQVRDFLLRRRFPSLSELNDRRAQSLKALKLPSAIKLQLDPQLEDIETTIKLTFTDTADLKNLARKLLEMTDQQEFKSLFSNDDSCKSTTR